MIRLTRRAAFVAAHLTFLVAGPVRAQQAVPLPTVLATFLADSGVPTRGLAWDRGASLPVRWDTPAPVAAQNYLMMQGLTQVRSGMLQVAIGDTIVREAMLTIAGTPQGIQRVDVSIASLDSWLTGPIEAALEGGLTLRPLKCARETEGASFGNVAWVVRAPRKTASAAVMIWNCGHDGCGIQVGIRYRRADLNEIECTGGG